MSKKSFLMILGPIWSKIVFWKNKLPNLPKNTENPWFFEFLQITKWPEVTGSGRNWPIIIPKHWLCPKVFPKFFLCPKPKNSWKYSQKITPPFPKKGHFFGGGVMILNVVFAGFDAACLNIFFDFFFFSLFFFSNFFFHCFHSGKKFEKKAVKSQMKFIKS